MSTTHRVNSMSDILNLKPSIANSLATQAKSISARTFDPIDFVQTNVPSEKARAQILSSMAWYIDVTLIGQVRSLFFDVFRDMQVGGDIDSYNEYLAAMSEREQRETNLVDQGFMESEGIYSIRRLLLLRQTWHDAALINPRHIMPSIEQLLLNEKPQMPNSLTKEKLRFLADDECPNDKAAADELYADLVKREELQAVDRHEASKARIPAMAGMCAFIGNTSTLAEAEFNDLPLDTRKRLITGIRNAVGQALQRLATDRTVNVLDFAAARRELKAALVLIDEVLAAPMFNEQSQQDIDEARQEQREATGDWQAASTLKSDQRKEIVARRH